MIPASPRFFVRGLASSIQRQTMQHLTPEAREAAAPFVHSRLFEPYASQRIAQSFANHGSPSRVFIEHALRSEAADSLATDLFETSFVPHHHAPYPLHIAPLRSINPNTNLGKFTTWLRSPAAAAYHVLLAGFSSLPRSISSAWLQVQVSRMTTGQFFPIHIDTDEEGLTCVYQFTRDYTSADGGQLYFGKEERSPDFVVSPIFGSLFMFCPRNVPHGVSRVSASAERPRFTITAFYLYGDSKK
jgi:Rps23 Pro-64 3,4-dihydroxylase Tpa1-like proline 4-hydroxylase